MTNCENCGKPLDHDFADVGMCPHCLDGEINFEEDYLPSGQIYSTNLDTVQEDDY